MNKQSKLIKNSIILILGKFCTQFITFLLLPLYTTNLSTQEYGIVDLITTYTTLLVPIITIQIEMALFRFLIDCRKEEEKKSIIISNAYFIVSIISIFFTILGFGIINIFHIQYGMFLILMVLIAISSSILLQSSRGIGDNLGYSLGCIIAGVSNIVLNIILLLHFEMGIYSVFLSTIISNFICVLFLLIRNKFYQYCSMKFISKKVMKEIVSYSLPLVPNGIVWWVINTSDRTLISITIGTSANGIYSVSNKFSNIINSFYGIFNMSWTESVSLYIDDKDNFLQESFNVIFKFICSFCLLLISGMFIIFPILVETKFSDAYRYIPLLIISSIFSMLSANLSSIYIAKKKTKEIAKTTVLASILNIVINLALIKKYKLYAAVFSTLISFFVVFILRYFDVQKYINLALKKSNIVIFSILFLISFLIYTYNNLYINMINLLLMIFLLVIINRKEIIAIIKKIRMFLRNLHIYKGVRK